MSFGLSNTPDSFQGYIKKILGEKRDIFVIVYLDNILIYTTNSSRQYVEAVYWVMKQLQEQGLYTNLKKCRFYKNKVQFLDFIISA